MVTFGNPSSGVQLNFRPEPKNHVPPLQNAIASKKKKITHSLRIADHVITTYSTILWKETTFFLLGRVQENKRVPEKHQFYQNACTCNVGQEKAQ